MTTFERHSRLGLGQRTLAESAVRAAARDALPTNQRRMNVVGVAAAALVFALGVSGCTAGSLNESSAQSPLPSTGAEMPAAERAQFEQFYAALSPLAARKLPQSAAVRSALTDAGFDAGRLEVTADMTPNGLNVDTIGVGYRYDDATCFVGQFINGTFLSEPAAPVNNACLIGQPE